MILCLDIGNTNLYGGVYKGETLLTTFRRDMRSGWTADEFGIFFRTVLRENGIKPEDISTVGISSVVPGSTHSISGACQKYFNTEPFILGVGAKTGIKVTTRNPVEVGADRIANAIAGSHRHPNKDLIIIDFGTATTFCAVTKDKEYLGGAILAGVRISMEALESRTARLPRVDILKPSSALGRSTIESIQSGLYWGNVGAIRELTKQLSSSCFNGRTPHVIATGGFARVFNDEGIFNEIEPDLVLEGIRISLTNEKNVPERSVQ